MTYFEEAFIQFVRTSLGELIREQVAEHLEMHRGPAWVTKKEAAQLLRCSTRTVARHISLGRLATSKPPQSPMLVERASIEELLEGSRMPRLQWRYPWTQQPRNLNPHKSPAHVAAGKLGHERRRLREMGIHDEITLQVIAEAARNREQRARRRQDAKRNKE